MSKKTLSIIAISFAGIAVASLAYAAVATKYFQRIKQVTRTGNTTVKITQGNISLEQTSVFSAFANWQPGDAIPDVYGVGDCAYQQSQNPSTFQADQCLMDTIVITQKRNYTTKVTGIPSVSTTTDPPIFYSKVTYLKNGKKVNLPEAGVTTYTEKTTSRAVHYDGSYTDTVTNATDLPTVGTSTYQYKLITLQPSN